jgi:hypothetical protein
LQGVSLWKHAFPLQATCLSLYPLTEYLDGSPQLLYFIRVEVLNGPPLLKGLGEKFLWLHAAAIGKFGQSFADHPGGPAMPPIGLIEFVLRDPEVG